MAVWNQAFQNDQKIIELFLLPKVQYYMANRFWVFIMLGTVYCRSFHSLCISLWCLLLCVICKWMMYIFIQLEQWYVLYFRIFHVCVTIYNSEYVSAVNYEGCVINKLCNCSLISTLLACIISTAVGARYVLFHHRMVCLSVCLSVCLYVGHTGELCKNSWTSR